MSWLNLFTVTPVSTVLKKIIGALITLAEYLSKETCVPIYQSGIGYSRHDRFQRTVMQLFTSSFHHCTQTDPTFTSIFASNILKGIFTNLPLKNSTARYAVFRKAYTPRYIAVFGFEVEAALDHQVTQISNCKSAYDKLRSICQRTRKTLQECHNRA